MTWLQPAYRHFGFTKMCHNQCRLQQYTKSGIDTVTWLQ